MLLLSARSSVLADWQARRHYMLEVILSPYGACLLLCIPVLQMHVYVVLLMLLNTTVLGSVVAT